jgi:site-specific recombinase XerD
VSNIKDPGLFKSIKHFLTVFLPKIKSKSPHTIQAYKSTISVFANFLKESKGIRLHQLSKDDFCPDYILEFLEWLQTSRGNSAATKNQRLRCLRVFCKYLVGENILSFEVYARIQNIASTPTPERFLEKTLSIDEVKHLLELPKPSTKFGLRDRFYMALLYDTGCRSSEIISINLGDINRSKEYGSVKVIGKGQKPRITPISQEVIAMFKQYADVFHADRNFQKPLFYTENKNGVTRMSADNAARILNKYEIMANARYPDLPHLHPHLFRHARAMHLYHAGMPLPLVAEWLGHSQLETTLIYANADAAMKKEAMDKLVKSSENTVFTNEAFIFQDDELTIKRLYGLD